MSGPSVVEYARFHGLAIDHTAEDILTYLSHLRTELRPEENDLSVPEPDFSAFKHDLQEPKLQLTREASMLLAESINDPCPVIDWDHLLPKCHRIEDLKLEEPLLATDHETDVRSFKRSALRARDSHVLLAQFTPNKCFPDNVFEKEWDDIVHGRSLRAVKEQLKQEKVHTVRESLVRLSKALKHDSTDKEREEAMTKDLSSIKRSQSPPTPLTALEASSPVTSPSTASEFPIATCSQDKINLDDLLLDVEQEMQEKDQDLRNSGRKLNPLTEYTSEETPEKLSAKGEQDLQKIAVPRLPEVTLEAPLDVPRSGFLTSLLDEVFQISDLSSDLQDEGRLDCSLLLPSLPKTGIRERIEDTGQALEVTRPPRGVIRSEQALWKQPGLRLLDLSDESDGEMEEDEELARVMSCPPTPYIPQKRVAADGDSKPRSPIKVSQSQDKMDVDNIGPNAGTSAASKRSLLPASAFKYSLPASLSQEMQERNESITFQRNHSTNSNFSASGAVVNFLDLRGSKFKKPQPSQQPCMGEISNDPIQTTQSQSFDLPCSQGLEPTTDFGAPETVQVPATPCNKPLQLAGDIKPSVVTFDRPISIVLDTAMLRTQRPLISYLEQHGGEMLTLIYRDLSADDTREPGGPSNVPDIILNPCTAVIFTHFQALNQKNLPGQGNSAAQGMVQSKILRLMQVYDHLFVLITMPGSGDRLPPAAQVTIASFTGFCSREAVQTTGVVRPIWISAGASLSTKTTDLHSWVWRLICQHGFPVSDPSRSLKSSPEDVSLIHDETLWELFLRRAGINPMAAQVVLAMLKRPDEHENQAGQSWGLRKLVQMKPEERFRSLAEILGWKTVERLNVVL